MAHTAYLLACAGMNFYAGYTPDITRRVFLHETGRGARYTRAHRPVRLVYTCLLYTSISGLHKLFREEHGNLYKKRAKKFYI